MFEMFSPNAIKVIMFAQEEARASGDRQILPEHLLLAILRVDSVRGNSVLLRYGIDAERFRKMSNLSPKPNFFGWWPVEIPFGSEVSDIAKRATEAVVVGETTISADQLLLAIFENSSRIKQIFDSAGTSAETVSAQLRLSAK